MEESGDEREAYKLISNKHMFACVWKLKYKEFIRVTWSRTPVRIWVQAYFQIELGQLKNKGESIRSSRYDRQGLSQRDIKLKNQHIFIKSNFRKRTESHPSVLPQTQFCLVIIYATAVQNKFTLSPAGKEVKPVMFYNE